MTPEPGVRCRVHPTRHRMPVPVRVVVAALLLVSCGEVSDVPSDTPSGADPAAESPSPRDARTSEASASDHPPTPRQPSPDEEEHTAEPGSTESPASQSVEPDEEEPTPRPTIAPPKDLPATPETDKPVDPDS